MPYAIPFMLAMKNAADLHVTRRTGAPKVAPCSYAWRTDGSRPTSPRTPRTIAGPEETERHRTDAVEAAGRGSHSSFA